MIPINCMVIKKIKHNVKTQGCVDDEVTKLYTVIDRTTHLVISMKNNVVSPTPGLDMFCCISPLAIIFRYTSDICTDMYIQIQKKTNQLREK